MKILLVDDHALFREGLSYVLQQLSDVVEIVEAGTFQDGLTRAAAETGLDLALLDLHMPGSEGPKSVSYFHQCFPAIPVVVISGEEASANIEKVINYGAAGFICKSASSQVMLGALRLVLSGGVYVPPEILRHQVEVADKRNMHGLTPRQLDVLEHLCSGMSNKTIAAAMNLAEGTVKIHVAAIYHTLNVSSRLEAVRAAEHLGLFGVAHG
jgi:DNA-binding NarL/FixJ family response regulator